MHVAAVLGLLVLARAWPSMGRARDSSVIGPPCTVAAHNWLPRLLTPMPAGLARAPGSEMAMNQIMPEYHSADGLRLSLGAAFRLPLH